MYYCSAMSRYSVYFISYITAWLITCLASEGFGQNYIMDVQSFGINKGLSGRNVTDFYKDTRGFMWVSTDLGLNRFDGYSFKVYSRESHGFQHNIIKHIAGDKQGNLWLMFKGRFTQTLGIDVFDPITEKRMGLKEYLGVKKLPFSIDQIHSIEPSPNYGVYLALETGDIYRYYEGNLTQIATIKLGASLIDIYPLPDGGFWLMLEHDLIRFNSEGKQVRVIPSVLTLNSIIYIDAEYNPYYLVIDFDAAKPGDEAAPSILYYNGQKVAKMPNFLARIIGLDLGANKVYSMKYRSTDNEVIISDTLGNIIETLASQKEIYADSMAFLIKEAWEQINMSDQGIYLVSTYQTPFNKVLYDIKSIFGMPYGGRGIYQLPSGELMVNGLGRSYLVDLSNRKHTQFGKNLKFFYKHEDNYFYAGLGVMEDSRGNIWLTDEQFRLMYYDVSSRAVKGYSYDKKFLEELEEHLMVPSSKSYPLMQWSLFEDAEHKIWIGHQCGLSYLDREEGRLKLFENYQEFEELNKSSVYHFHPNDQGVWLATNSGLYLFDPKSGVKDRFHIAGVEGKKIPHNHIVHIHEDDRGFFWLATKGGGLIQWHPKTKETHQFTTADGLSNNIIYAVYEDDYGKLWISSNKGIMRFDKATYAINIYLEKDGLSHKEFNTISHYKGKDGTIYFGGLNGITYFHPKDFLSKSITKYPLEITSLKIQDQHSGNLINYTKQVIDSKQIVLKASDISFTLEFAYLNFDISGVQYAYKLDGLDKDWNYQTIPQIKMNGLPYGTYNLQIKAQGELGIWEEPINFPVVKLKPFYLQNWFIVICIILGICIIWLIIRLRTLRLEKEQARLENVIASRTATISEQANELRKLDKLKSKFFANISHELRTPLTLILGPIHQLSQRLEDKQDQKLLTRAKKNTESLQKMVDEILDLSKFEANKMELKEQPTNFYKYIATLVSNFESRAQYLGIMYEFEFDSDRNLQLMLDQDKVEQVMSNLISNALKFTPKDGVTAVKVWTSGNSQFLSVKDTGMGISKEDLPHIFDRYYQAKDESAGIQGGSGIGLALAKEIALLMKGDLYAESTLGKGSEFIFTFPMKHSDASEETIAQIIQEEEFELSEAIMPIGTNDKPNHILIVEDHPEMQDYISEVLNPHSSIIRAINGKEALKVLSEAKVLPDLIISDVMMPEMNGFTFLEVLKNNARWKQIPVIMLTARVAEEDRLHALRIGVDDYLHKPFIAEELRARASNLITNYHLRKQFWKELLQENDGKQGTGETIVQTENNTMKEVDTEWLKKTEKLIQKQLTQVDFNLNSIAEQQHLSRRQFHRKIKALTGLSPMQYQREIQLQTAREYLEKGKYDSVAEVSYAIGIQTPQYLSKLFIQRFGRKPSAYL